MHKTLTPMMKSILAELATPGAARYWHGVPGIRQRREQALVVRGLVVVDRDDRMSLTPAGIAAAQAVR